MKDVLFHIENFHVFQLEYLNNKLNKKVIIQAKK